FLRAIRIRNLYTLFDLHRGQFHFPTGAEVAAGLVTVRTLRKKIVRLELANAVGTPKSRGHVLDVERRSLSQGSWRQRLKGKLQSLRDHAAQGANPQANEMNTTGTGFLSLIERQTKGAVHDR